MNNTGMAKGTGKNTASYPATPGTTRSNPIGKSQATAITTAGPTPRAAKPPVNRGIPMTVLMAAMLWAASSSEASGLIWKRDLSWFIMLVMYSAIESGEPGIATPSIPGILISVLSVVVFVVISTTPAVVSSELIEATVTGSNSGKIGNGYVGNGFFVVVVLFAKDTPEVNDKVGLKVAKTAGLIVGLYRLGVVEYVGTGLVVKNGLVGVR